jgi:serine protease
MRDVMKRNQLFLLPVLLITLSGYSQKIWKSKTYADPYWGGKLHFRLKAEYAGSLPQNIPALADFLNQHQLEAPKKRFPNAQKPEKATNAFGQKYADISDIYTLQLPEGLDPETFVKLLLKTGCIRKAEPHFLPQLCYVPSDDSVGVQYALQKIAAFAAWDVHRGDSTTVVGITDTGIDPNHSDLTANIARNWADPVNGIDDDNDGYIDNFIGWDTGNNDADPTSDGTFHGQHVTGLSSATTDNGLGIAGTGFDCRFIHVKIANSSGALSGAYEGLVYAAEHGCKIVNCSWGGSQYSEFNDDIIRYVSVNLDRLVICGSGNNNNDLPFYPAAYELSYSIGATTAADSKADFSNFGYSLDLFAPGEYVISTWANNGYLVSGGTSMAAPVVAGAAALLSSAFPQLNSRQIAEKLKLTADPIDTLSSNQNWENRMGSGRLNMFRALTETGVPAPCFHETQITDNAANQLLPGDTLMLSGIITNYLFPTNMVNVEISCADGFLNPLTSQLSLGAMGTLSSYIVNEGVLKFLIAENCPVNQQSVIRLRFISDGNIRDQYIGINLHADFVNIAVNDVQTSIGSYGLSGISGNGYIRGLGFKYRGNSDLLYECGLMVALNENTVADVVRGEGTVDQEFSTIERIQPIPPFEGSTRQYAGKFGSTLPEIPVEISQRVLADSSAPNRKFVILEYTVENTGPQTLSNLSAGLFADWDLINAGMNGFSHEASEHAGYIHTLPIDSLYCGIRVLNVEESYFQAIDNVPGGGGGLNLYDGYSSTEKNFSLRNNRLFTGAGDAGTDVIMTAAGPAFSLEPGAQKTIAFALLAGDDIDDINVQAFNAETFYQEQGIALHQNTVHELGILAYPNPAKDQIHFKNETHSETFYQIVSVNGKIMENGRYNTNKTINLTHYPKGIYAVQFINERGSTSKLFVVNGY